jgi:C4-dicarboxylate transporter, DctM subunit
MLVASIFAEGVMAAVVGTSTGCIVTVGKVAIPALEKAGYNKRITLGAICAAGALGPLIPPSSIAIIYSLLAEVSLGKLFIAGVIPGILLALMLAVFTIVLCIVRPRLAPPPTSVPWKERIFSMRRIWPAIVLIVAVLGGIYAGVMTPTEAAGVGVTVAFILGILFFKFRRSNLNRVIMDSSLLTGMIMMMIGLATVFTFVVASSKLSDKLLLLIADANLSKWVVMLCINILLLILGCIMDGVTITLLCLPIMVPMVSGLGFDLIYFGIVFTVNMQMGLITPPVGMDLFVMKGLFNVPASEVLIGVLPYLAVLFVFLGIIIAFPFLSTWLPSTM